MDPRVQIAKIHQHFNTVAPPPILPLRGCTQVTEESFRLAKFQGVIFYGFLNKVYVKLVLGIVISSFCANCNYRQIAFFKKSKLELWKIIFRAVLSLKTWNLSIPTSTSRTIKFDKMHDFTYQNMLELKHSCSTYTKSAFTDRKCDKNLIHIIIFDHVSMNFAIDVHTYYNK